MELSAITTQKIDSKKPILTVYVETIFPVAKSNTKLDSIETTWNKIAVQLALVKCHITYFELTF